MIVLLRLNTVSQTFVQFFSQHYSAHVFLCYLFQVPVDIFKGVSDEDAKWLAEKLEFKGTLVEQVGLMIVVMPNIRFTHTTIGQ